MAEAIPPEAEQKSRRTVSLSIVVVIFVVIIIAVAVGFLVENLMDNSSNPNLTEPGTGSSQSEQTQTPEANEVEGSGADSQPSTSGTGPGSDNSLLSEQGILTLGKSKRLTGVTSRREGLKDITGVVLEKLAPGAVAEVMFCTYFKNGEKFTRPKKDICREINASHLIDDQIKHYCVAVGEVGVKSLLFGEYPWNKTDEPLPNNVTRVRNWSEVLKHFEVEPCEAAIQAACFTIDVMEDNELTVSGGSTNSAGQASNQSPQQSTNNTFVGARSSAVQPGTASAALTNNQGIQLESQPLTAVNVGNTASSQTTATKPALTPDNSKINPVLLVLTLLFIVVAIAMFWAIQRSVKSTTKY